MKVVRNEGYILTNDAKKDFEHWYKSNINYHPYKDMDKTFWDLPNFITLPIINLFFDYEKHFINTELNSVASNLSIDGNHIAVYRDRLKSLSEGIKIANKDYNFKRWIEKVRWLAKRNARLEKMSKNEIEKNFSKTNMEKYFNENLSPSEALRQELEFWSEAPR